MSEIQLSVEDFVAKLETASWWQLEYSQLKEQYAMQVREGHEVKTYVSPCMMDVSEFELAILRHAVDRISAPTKLSCKEFISKLKTALTWRVTESKDHTAIELYVSDNEKESIYLSPNILEMSLFESYSFMFQVNRIMEIQSANGSNFI